jgi:hypothetical protein
MNYSSRFFLYAPLALVLLIAAAISFHWWRTAGAFEDRLAAIKGREAMPGVTLDWKTVAISGFPFRLDALFEGFSARGDGARGPFRWDSEQVALHSLTYGADRKVFEAAGTQRLSWTDAKAQQRSFSFRPGALHASAVRDAQGLSRFDVDVVQLSGPDGLTIGRVQFHMRRGEGGKTLDMMVSADAASGDLGFYFGKGFKSLRLYQTLHGAAGYAPLLRGEISPKAAHAEWHDGGGVGAVTATEMNGKPNAMTPEQGGTIGELLEALY